jgi:hypothetical protein
MQKVSRAGEFVFADIAASEPFDQLNLDISYQPGELALHVALTLYDDRGP